MLRLCVIKEGDGALHAILSAYLSILAGLGELVMSMWAGHHEKSMSIYGIGIMAFVDIAGSILVLSMWQCGSPQGGARLISERRREMQYSAIIGVMMVFLGIFLIVDSFQRLVHRSKMDSSYLGVIDSVMGTLCGFSLAGYKYVVGKSLDSPVIIADSVSSLCGGLISCLALLVVFLDDELWWSDSSAGFTSALYTFYSGVTTIMSANSELSKLNRLHRGGPRPAPDYVRKLAKNSSDAQLFQAEATALGPYEGDNLLDAAADGGEWSSSGESSILRSFYRVLGLASPGGSSDQKDSFSKRKGTYSEKQHLLHSPLPPQPSSSEDQHDREGPTTFTA